MSKQTANNWIEDEAMTMLTGDDLANYREQISQLMISDGDKASLVDLVNAYGALSKSYSQHLTFLNETIETDLTAQVNNRKGILHIIQKEWEGSKRYHSPTSLIMVSVDNPKEDESLMSEQLVVELAQLIKKSTRLTDSIGRIDDNTFIIVVPTTNNIQAAWLGEKLREAIEKTSFGIGNPITCSFGVADSEASMNPEDWLSIVSAAHDQAAKDGGNSVVDFEDM